MKGRQQRLVVGPKLELAALQSIPEVVDGGEGGQQLPVKAEYLHSVEDNFLEKKPSGPQPLSSHCCRTPPMWASDASVANDSSPWGSRCASGTATTRAAKDTCMSGDQTRTFRLPFSASVWG